jgi:hypothetical protein
MVGSRRIGFSRRIRASRTTVFSSNGIKPRKVWSTRFKKVRIKMGNSYKASLASVFSVLIFTVWVLNGSVRVSFCHPYYENENKNNKKLFYFFIRILVIMV